MIVRLPRLGQSSLLAATLSSLTELSLYSFWMDS